MPAAAVDFEKWSNALHSMLETHLDADELERRRTVAKDVEPLYQRHSDYLQKKGQLIMRSFAQVGFMENEKKNCMRQGVVSLQNDEGVWKKSFLLLKKFVATYHESGKSYKKGFINLKLARVERSAKSAKRFKIITPMCVYSIKVRQCAVWCVRRLTLALFGRLATRLTPTTGFQQSLLLRRARARMTARRILWANWTMCLCPPSQSRT